MLEHPEAAEPYVFLSYTTPDRTRVLALADTLEAAGLRVWVDRRNIVGGSSWDEAIVEAIRRCTVFAVLCSQAAMASPNVLQELRLAQQNRKPILPLVLEPVTYPPAMEYSLAGRQWVELLDRPEAAWLADVLRALTGLGLTPASPQAVAVRRSAERAVGHLPTPLTSFIGREQDLAELTALLGTVRLLTLTGPGGTGKTRLALAAAAQVAARYPEGVWFVDLSGIADPAGVLPAIAQLLEVPESEGRSLAASLAASLRRKQLLLVLDNFEQVVAAAMTMYDLLAKAPGLSLLVTSRVLLRVAGEQEYAVPPLPLPEESAAADATRLRQNPAVRLFVDRARALRPALALTEEALRAIGEICWRLDGLPLAIELAAAQVKLLPPAALLPRLDRRLALLSGGIRSLPSRQQTLRATIAWSWDLLSEPERVLFRQLAVFAGGWTMEATEAVCNPAGELDVLGGLAALVDQSLVQQREVEGEPRLGMLVTLREFALEQLAASGETAALRRRHAGYYGALAEQATTAFGYSDHRRAELLRPLAVERDNLLAALGWALGQEVPDPDGEEQLCALLLALAEALLYAGDLRAIVEEVAPRALHLAEALGDRGRASRACLLALQALRRFGAATQMTTPEYRLWVERLDERAAPGTVARVWADAWRAALLHQSGRHSEGWELAGRALTLARTLGDPAALALAVFAVIYGNGRPSDRRQRLAAAEEFAHLTEQLADDGSLLLNRVLLQLFLSAGRREEVEGQLRQLERYVERSGDARLGLTSAVWRARLAPLDGRLEEALSLGEALVQAGEELGSAVWGRQQASLVRMWPLVQLGRAEEALQDLPLASPLAGAEPTTLQSAWRIMLLACTGQVEEARTALQAFAARLEQEQRQCAETELCAALITAVTVGDVSVGSRVAAELAAGGVDYGETVDWATGTCTARFLGALAVLQGDREEAQRRYGQALAVAARVRSRPETALTHLALAELLLAGDAEEQRTAQAHLDVAIGEFDAMKMQPALAQALSHRDVI